MSHKPNKGCRRRKEQRGNQVIQIAEHGIGARSPQGLAPRTPAGLYGPAVNQIFVTWLFLL